MKKLLLISALVLATAGYGQSIFCSFGYGGGYHISDNSALQNSYDSYKTYIGQAVESNGLQLTEVDPNFTSGQFDDVFSFHGGFSGEGIAFTVSYFQNKARQERAVRWSNNYGRSFDWYELRREVLFDLGYGSKHFDFYGTFGVHFDWFRMTSYTLYPDGSRSLTNDAGFNGVYKYYNTGISLGAGMKYKFNKYIALDLRYIFSRAAVTKDGITEDSGLADDSFSKNPNFSYFPADFTQPIGVNTGNELIPTFNRQLLSLSILYFFNFNN